MIVAQCEIPDIKMLEPRLINDDRGYFFESFNATDFKTQVGSIDFCQDNESHSKKFVIRGLHYQVGAAAQSKLVRVVNGAIWDVVVDMRRSSPTFKRWFGVELSAINKKQIFVPAGFAHGFLSLEDDTVVQYKVDSHYSAKDERGIRFDDEQIGICWPKTGSFILSEKDRTLPKFEHAETFV